jgi:hypothetical protein
MLRTFLATLFLCLSIPVAAKLQSRTELASGEGAVMFQLSNDFPSYLPGSTGPLISVERVGSNGKDIYFLEAGRTGFRTTLSYLGALPAGTYRVIDFQGVPCKILCAGPTLPPPEGFPEFEVNAGHMRYLGTIGLAILSNSFNSASDGFKKYWSWHSAPDVAEGKRLMQAYPELTTYSGNLDTGWVRADSAKSQIDRLMIKTISFGMQGATDYGEDGFYFSSHNGMIKRYKPGKAIELIDTGHDFMVTSVRELAPGRIFTTAEAGILRYSDDEGRTWQDRANGIEFGLAANAVIIGNDDVAFTVQKNETVLLYRGAPSTGNWKKIAEFPLVFATWTGLPGAQPELFHHQGKLVLTLPSRKLAVIDLTDNSAELRDPPGSIGMFKLSADGVLRCSCAKTIAISPYESRDFGKTWAPAEFSRFLYLPEFHDSMNGFSYQGAVFSAKNTGLSFTRDGGKTWDFTNYPEIGRSWWQPSYSRNGQVLMLYSLSMFGSTALQSTKLSQDGGKTWSAIPNRLVWLYPPLKAPLPNSEAAESPTPVSMPVPTMYTIPAPAPPTAPAPPLPPPKY